MRKKKIAGVDGHSMFDCTCYNPQSTDENSPMSREACRCKKYKIELLNIFKVGKSTFFSGLSDICTSSNLVKILTSKWLEFYPTGVLNKAENGRSNILLREFTFA